MAVVALEVKTRQALAGGQEFGSVGRYVQLDGTAHFALDPAHPLNRGITDIDLAARGGDGRLHFAADFRILVPKDKRRGNHRLLFDVVIGVPLPGGELPVALSVLVLGACVVYRRRVPLAVALAVVGVFAIAHGHAHGTELPGAADPLAFTIGFVGTTGLLHLAGIVLGLLGPYPNGALAIRACGVLIALTGCYFVYSHAGV